MIIGPRVMNAGEMILQGWMLNVFTNRVPGASRCCVWKVLL
jgi:hypothetical protein